MSGDHSGRILVCVASRDRNIALGRMIDSVRRCSSGQADIALYVDEDQAEMYAGELARVDCPLVGPQKGPCASLNELWGANPGYAAYGALTDDCEIESGGFDQWVLTVAREKPVTAIAPHLHGSRRMDFPWATARWCEALGWLAYPECYHFYWDVVVEVVGAMTSIVYAGPGQFTVQHDSAPCGNLDLYMFTDAKKAIVALAFEREQMVDKIRRAMEQS